MKPKGVFLLWNGLFSKKQLVEIRWYSDKTKLPTYGSPYPDESLMNEIDVFRKLQNRLAIRCFALNQKETSLT